MTTLRTMIQRDNARAHAARTRAGVAFTPLATPAHDAPGAMYTVRVLDCTESDTMHTARVRLARVFVTYADASEYASAINATDADALAVISYNA